MGDRFLLIGYNRLLKRLVASTSYSRTVWKQANCSNSPSIVGGFPGDNFLVLIAARWIIYYGGSYAKQHRSIVHSDSVMPSVLWKREQCQEPSLIFIDDRISAQATYASSAIWYYRSFTNRCKGYPSWHIYPWRIIIDHFVFPTWNLPGAAHFQYGKAISHAWFFKSLTQQ